LIFCIPTVKKSAKGLDTLLYFDKCSALKVTPACEKECAPISSLLKSTDLADLVKAISITDFIVSVQSVKVSFAPNPFKYLRTTPMSQNTEYLTVY